MPVLPYVPPTIDESSYKVDFKVRHKADNAALGADITYTLIDESGNVSTRQLPSNGIVRIVSQDVENCTIIVHDYSDVFAGEENE